MDLFEIVGKLVIKTQDGIDALHNASQEGEKTQGKLSKAFSAVGKGAAVAGKAVMTGLAAGGTAMAALTGKALGLSGELEQNMGGSEAVFGKYANKMQATAKDAFGNMGLSTSDFLATANKMGALFQGAGFDIEESADLSSDAMQRAADVASIMGVDTSAAMEAIAGAAKGNFTMMDNLGVAMNDTTLQNYALSKGIKKSTQDMTNQEKIGLAMEMFMEKTAYAAGNYAKENETLAGSLGTAKAALTNFLDGSGDVESLVSSFGNLADVAVKNITEIVPRLTTGLSEIVQKIIPQLPPMIKKLLPPIIEGAVALIDGLVAAMPTIIAALMACLPQLIDGFVQLMNAVVEALPQIMDVLVAALPELIPQLVDGLVSMIVMMCTNFAQIIQPLIDYLPEIIIVTVQTLLDNLPVLLAGIGQLIMGIVRAIPQLLSALWQSITTLASQFATTLFGKIEGWIRKLFPKSADTVMKILKTIKNAFSTLVKNIGQILSVVVSVISTPFKLAWNGVKLAWDNCVAFFKMIWQNIKAVFSVVDSVLAGDFRGAWNSIKQIWSNVTGFFKQIITNVKNAFANVGEILAAPFRKGRDAVKNIVNNIKGFFSGLKLSFPKIKLPHFSVSPKGWKIGDLLKGSLPKLGIEWYAKGGIMNKPTIFDYNPATGNVKVGGEAGAEAVAPISTLQQYIRAAVQSENGGLLAKLDRIIELLTQFFPDVLSALLSQVMVLDDGTLVAKLAPAMDAELGKIAIKKGRGR